MLHIISNELKNVLIINIYLPIYSDRFLNQLKVFIFPWYGANSVRINFEKSC